MNLPYRLVIVALLLSLLISPVISASGELPENAKLFPPETDALISIENFTQLRNKFKGTNIYKLYTAPALAAFVTKTKEKLKELASSSGNVGVKAIANADVLPSGKVAVAVVASGNDFENIAVSAVTQWGDNIDTVKNIVKKINAEAIENEASRTAESYRSVEIIKMTISRSPMEVPDYEKFDPQSFSTPPGPNDSAAPPAPPTIPTKTVEQEPIKINYSFIDDTFLVSTDLDMHKFVIAQIKGSSAQTLAETGEYTNAMKSLDPYHDIDIYINFKKIIKESFAGPPSGQMQTYLKAFGVDSIVSLASSIALTPKPMTNSAGKMALKIDGEKRGIFKILECTSAPFDPPKFIDAESCSLSFINWDINAAYNELFSILANLNPMIAAGMNSPITPPSPDGKPGLLLKQDVLNYIGSQFVTAETVTAAETSKETMQTNSVFCVSINNKTALEDSLSRLHSTFIASGNPEAKRSFLGHNIYLIELPGFFFPAGQVRPVQDHGDEINQTIPEIAFAVTDTHLIFGEVSSIEQAIRLLNDTDNESVASRQWYRSARAIIPSSAGLASFSDDSVYARQGWREFKNYSKNMQLGTGMFISMDEKEREKFKDIFDVSLLPEFDAVKKYFGISTFYAQSTPQGFKAEFQVIENSNTTP